MFYQLQKIVRYYTPTYEGGHLRVSGEDYAETEDFPSIVKPDLLTPSMYFSGTSVLAVEFSEILSGKELDDDRCFYDCEIYESSQPKMAEIRKFFWENVPV